MLRKIVGRGKGWGRTENKIIGWHYQLSGHEFEQTPGDSERQGAWCAAVHGLT